MGAIAARRVLPHPPECVFGFLSDLRNHWLLDDAFIAVNGIGTESGRILIRGPLGFCRQARTELVSADPMRLVGRARLGRSTVGTVVWDVAAEDGGALLTLSARVEHASPGDRLLLALGGRRWLSRRFMRMLETLERRLD